MNFCRHFVISLIIVFVKSESYCRDNLTLAEFPNGFGLAIFDFLTTPVVDHVTGCQVNTSVSPDEVRFWLYTRSNQNNPTLLNRSSPQLDTTKNVIVLIHGWLCNVTDGRIPELKNAYLTKYDADVIAVEWASVAVDLYTTAYCRLSNVAILVGDFLCNLSSVGVNLSATHVVGFSMGGQIAGLAGQTTQLNCSKKLGRITGLDPAGDPYETDPPEKRLNPADADFVDVIHTSGSGLTYYEPCGHADFFPNCGSIQPRCLQPNVTYDQVANLPLRFLLCDHFAACDYMVESIVPIDKKFYSNQCVFCPEVCVTNPFACRVLMGEECPSTTRGGYTLQTNTQSPYAEG